MSDGHPVGGSQPTDEELATMSRDELVTLGLKNDDVELAYRRDRWPVKGTKAEKRAERSVAAWFLLSGFSALAFFGVYVFWPWQYETGNGPATLWYTFYTPMLGVTMGLAILGLGVGVIAYAKKFIPDETAVQQRHMGGSPEVDKKTTVALLGDSMESIGIGRRKLIKRSLGFGAGALGIMAIMPFGGLINNPWAQGPDSPLWTTAGHRRTTRRSTCGCRRAARATSG